MERKKLFFQDKSKVIWIVIVITLKICRRSFFFIKVEKEGNEKCEIKKIRGKKLRFTIERGVGERESVVKTSELRNSGAKENKEKKER